MGYRLQILPDRRKTDSETTINQALVSPELNLSEQMTDRAGIR